MSWSKINNEDIETTYTSEAKEVDEIVPIIQIVAERLIKNMKLDNAEDSKEILFYVSATNGNISISWYDSLECETRGNRTYWIELPDLWELSTLPDEDALVFDYPTQMSIDRFAKSDSGKKLKENYKLYLEDELDDAVQI